MSQIRHSVPRSIETMPGPLVAVAADFDPGERIDRHHHPCAQLVYATRGVMTVTTDQGTWVVPSQRAVWVPPFVVHSIQMSGRVRMRTLYIAPGLPAAAPGTCCVVNVSPLMRELILRVVEFDAGYAAEPAQERLAAVLLDELQVAPVAPLHLPAPEDPRLLVITRALLDEPGNQRTLTEWGRRVGASSRTLARLFERDTSMSFRAWRRHARLLRALELLAAGEPVTSIALALGYDGPSAFIAMFRKALGATPTRYYRRPSRR
jgi:AraC-like DNA-binding protein